MIIQPEFLDHWKTRFLCESLNDPLSPIYLIRLWGHCQTSKKWVFDFSNPLILKAICGHSHDPQVFLSTLIQCQFIDIEDGEHVIHGWEELNASLINSWKHGAKGGRPKGAKQKPTGTPRVTHGLSSENPRVISGKPTGTPRVTHGLSSENPRVISGKPTDNPRITHGVTDREDKRREDREDGEETSPLPPEGVATDPKSWQEELAFTIAGCRDEFRHIQPIHVKDLFMGRTEAQCRQVVSKWINEQATALEAPKVPLRSLGFAFSDYEKKAGQINGSHPKPQRARSSIR